MSQAMFDWFATHEARLRVLAALAFERAYAPYSHFRVGAALVTRSGKIFMGCNVENASYGGTVCAERNAIAAAVVAGATDIAGIVVFTSAPTPTPPCGICRQVLVEFNATMPVVAFNTAGHVQRWMLNDLLPSSFSKRDLLPTQELDEATEVTRVPPEPGA